MLCYQKRLVWVFLIVAVVGAMALVPNRQGIAGSNVATKKTLDPEIKFERYRLENGLEIILHQDKRVPLVAVNVWVHVGSGDEVPGRSGFAHLFEHMMFQGTKHTDEDAHFKILRRIGASSINGTTNSDRTNYFEVVPSHQLEVALWLESDRLGYMLPTLTEKSLDNQRAVVRNERRQSYDNRPYGKEWFAVLEALYAEDHPYRYGTIGRHEDLAQASLQDVKNFYMTWYVPANTTLAVAGDFEISQSEGRDKEMVRIVSQIKPAGPQRSTAHSDYRTISPIGARPTSSPSSRSLRLAFAKVFRSRRCGTRYRRNDTRTLW